MTSASPPHIDAKKVSFLHKAELTPIHNIRLLHTQRQFNSAQILISKKQTHMLSSFDSRTPKCSLKVVSFNKPSILSEVENSMLLYIYSNKVKQPPQEQHPWPVNLVTAILSDDKNKILKFLRATQLSINEKKEVANLKNSNLRTLLIFTAYKSQYVIRSIPLIRNTITNWCYHHPS